MTPSISSRFATDVSGEMRVSRVSDAMVAGKWDAVPEAEAMSPGARDMFFGAEATSLGMRAMSPGAGDTSREAETTSPVMRDMSPRAAASSRGPETTSLSMRDMPLDAHFQAVTHILGVSARRQPARFQSKTNN